MSIIIGGDICPTDITMEKFENGDIEGLFGTATALFERASKTIINLECALTESDTPIRKCGPNLRAKPIVAKTLKKLGVDICGLSNNHVFDYGMPGFKDTLKALDEEGIAYTGIGENEQDARKPYYFEAEGKKFALVCVAEHEYSYALRNKAGVWGFDPFEAMEDISKAKENADFVIVMYHGGKEQCEYPSPRLRRACQAMARAGADVILCQHSHCIGVYEEYNGTHIMYGQGNFQFIAHPEHPHWQSGTLVELEVSDKLGFKVYPLIVNNDGVTLAQGSEKQTIMNAIMERGEILLDEDKWLAEWNKFCKSVEEGYRKGIAVAFANGGNVPAEIFPHYLDCEAHTDVWRELYKTWHGWGTDEV